MKELILKSDKANLYMRISLGCIGMICLGFSMLLQYFSDSKISTGAVLNAVLGLGMIVLAVSGSNVVWNVKLNLNKKYLRATEDYSIIRTAYWQKLKKVELSPFFIRVEYQSGTRELFRLPYLENKQRQDLKRHLLAMSKENSFKLEERPWWKF